MCAHSIIFVTLANTNLYETLQYSVMPDRGGGAIKGHKNWGRKDPAANMTKLPLGKSRIIRAMTT